MSEEVMIETGQPVENNVEKLKLFKNTKGYNWEIQLIKGTNETFEEMKKRLDAYNFEMTNSYGQ